MFFSEMDKVACREMELNSPREEKSLIPIDTHSQLGTEYTGRPEDTKDPECLPMSHEERAWRRGH